MSDCSTMKRLDVCPKCEGTMVENVSEYEPSLIHLRCPNCNLSITRDAKTCGNCRWWMPDPTEQGRAGQPDQCGACPHSYDDEFDYYQPMHADEECRFCFHPEEGSGAEGLAFELRTDTLERHDQQLDNTIEHLDELLRQNDFSCDECHAGHEQLREWLLELKALKPRYKQLEQVAKDMLAFMEASRAASLPFNQRQCEMFTKQLVEALEVSLDV